MKNIRKIMGGALVMGTLLTACNKDFLNVNDDPNNPTDNNITPELIFTQATEGVGGILGGANLAFLQNWMGYFAANGDFARDQQQTSYGIDFSFSNTPWIGYYNNLFDLHQAKTKALLPGGDTVLAGAAMVLSAKLYQDLVDIFGNVPYSKAFQVFDHPTPEYDKAQDIYNDLQTSLDLAITYLNKTQKSTFAGADILAHGNTGLWIRFANSIKLRLLIRQSEVAGFDPSAEIAKINSNGGILLDGEAIVENPGYSNDVNKQNPFFATFGYTTGTTPAPASTAINANAYILNKLTSSMDPRVSRFFTKVGIGYVGCVYGDDPGNIPSSANCSYFGPGLIGKDPDQTTAEGASQDQAILPSFENMFFKAEAIARGWMPGDAKTAFEAAITASFIWLRVPNATVAASDYINKVPSADWSNAGATPLSKAKFIAYQKYIALCGFDPLETWCDQRRLDFLPDNGYISVNPGRVSSTLPVRLLYPQTEYSSNSVNVLKEGTINQFTSKLFWQP